MNVNCSFDYEANCKILIHLSPSNAHACAISISIKILQYARDKTLIITWEKLHDEVLIKYANHHSKHGN